MLAWKERMRIGGGHFGSGSSQRGVPVPMVHQPTSFETMRLETMRLVCNEAARRACANALSIETAGGRKGRSRIATLAEGKA
jgi:hypothetical protein